MENMPLSTEICKHQSCLERFAMKFTEDFQDANDLVQDTIIKAIRYHNLYQEGTNLRGWLYTIMRNTYINDYRKKQQRRGVMEVTDEISSYQLMKSASSNLGENVFVMQDINKALDKLPKEYAVPFLKYFEGFKYNEIAEELNIPIGTVKTRIHCARQILKGKLKMHNKAALAR
jgi:RNA polymerase sigma factor (sigma-70 family)